MKTLLFSLSAIFLFASTAYCQDKVYTNEDLEQYSNRKADTSAPEAAPDSLLRTDEKTLSTENQRALYDYYCSTARYFVREIERFKDIVIKTRNEVINLRSRGHCKSGPDSECDMKMKRSLADLERAENDLRTLDQDANKKGIPRSWLHCEKDEGK